MDASISQASQPAHDISMPTVLTGRVSRDFRRGKKYAEFVTETGVVARYPCFLRLAGSIRTSTERKQPSVAERRRLEDKSRHTYSVDKFLAAMETVYC